MSEKPIPPVVNFGLAALAGCSGWMFVHPFDVVKTQLQANEGKALNPFKVCMDLGKREGLSGLYSGLSAGIMRQCTYTMLRVGLFNSMTEHYRDKPKTWYNGKVGLGLAAGALGAGTVCPVEVSLVRMQADSKAPVEQRRNYKHVFDAIFRIFKEEGVMAGYRGVGPTIGRGMMVTVTQLGTNDVVKETLRDDYGMKGFPLTFASAMIASVVVCVASNPLDTAKVRMQNQVVDPATGTKPYPNLPVTWYKMVTLEGPLSLWKGLFPWYLRGGGHTIFLLLFLDQYKAMYQKYVA
jgi:solute carrier family 25 oxoglutarate transporter 11